MVQVYPCTISELQNHNHAKVYCFVVAVLIISTKSAFYVLSCTKGKTQAVNQLLLTFTVLTSSKFKNPLGEKIEHNK